MVARPLAENRHASLRLAALASEVAAAEAGGLDWVAEQERLRLDAMRSEERRRQFLAGHWSLRCLAADVLGGEPAQWILGVGPRGVPRLASSMPGVGQGLAVSISHSADLLAVAIAPFPIGIDLEWETRPRDFLALAEAAFSPNECAELECLSGIELSRAFYRFWTIKEAVGKRAGVGLQLEATRRQVPLACTPVEADVVIVQFGCCSIALAGEVGMTFQLSGIPVEATRHYWRT